MLECKEGPRLPITLSRRARSCVLVLAALGCSGAPPPPPQKAPVIAAPPAPPKIELEKRYGTTWFRHGDGIRSVAVTKDGSTVLSCGEKAIVAFDAGTGAERQRLSTSCMRFVMSPDASRIAVIGEEKLSVYSVGAREVKPDPVWSAEVPKVFYQLHFREMAFSSDGRTLGVRIGWEDFRTYDVSNGKLLASHGFKAGYPDNDFVAVGPGGKSIVVTSRTPSLGTRLLSFDTGSSLVLEPPARLLAVWTSEGAKAFRWSRDGQLLLGIARLDNPNEEIICLWDAGTGKLTASWIFGGDRVDAVAFSRDEKSVIAVSDKELWQIDIASGDVGKFARSGSGDAQDLAISPDGRFLFSGDEGGTIRRWDLSLKADTTPAVQSYSCAALSTDNALALVGDGKLVTVDAKGEHVLSTDAKGRVKFSPNGKVIMTGAGALQLWSTESERLVGELPDYFFWPPFALADGWFAFVQYDEWKLFRRTYSSKGIAEKPALDLETPCIAGNFSRVALSRDQSKLAVIYGPGFDTEYCAEAGPDTFPDNARAKPIKGEAPAPYRLRIYDTKRWSVVTTHGLKGDQVPSIAIEADGDLVALGTASGIELWSSAKRRTIGTLPGNAEMADLTFIPDRHWLAVGLSTGKVQVYDYDKESLITELNAHAGSTICLDASAERLVSTGFEGTVAVWSLGAAPAKQP